MGNKGLTTDGIADGLISLSENIGLCDKETAVGLRTSKKKEILKSEKEHSFGKFTSEVRKRQSKKD